MQCLLDSVEMRRCEDVPACVHLTYTGVVASHLHLVASERDVDVIHSKHVQQAMR